jgi:hypothetical protein
MRQIFQTLVNMSMDRETIPLMDTLNLLCTYTKRGPRVILTGKDTIKITWDENERGE